MRYISDITGGINPVIREFPIASATAIKEGQFVQLTGNLIVACAVGVETAFLGVAVENHSGAADGLNIRSNGTKIYVACAPTQILEGSAPRITVTTGGTTTFIASAIATFVDDDFNGGFVKLVAKGASSTNPNPVGTIIPVVDFTASTKTFTIATTVISVGDIFEVYAPIGFIKGNLNATITNVVLTANNNLPIGVVGYDFGLGKVQYLATLATFGNKKA